MELIYVIVTLYLLLSMRADIRKILGKAAPAILLALVTLGGIAQAGEPVQAMHLSPEVRSYFKNPDGSCVQCSIGMAGVHSNDLNAASLLWDTPYGKAERGGSWPSRVESYCDARGIKAWSVTGNTPADTLPWIEWAAKTGRFAAIGAGTAHFQTLYGYDKERQKWYVCNNNSTHKIDEYTPEQFLRLHAASGPWVVILEKPSSPPPFPHKWWK